jgi:hypothetical protein
MSKQKTDRPQQPEPVAIRAPIWRQRCAVVIAAAILLPALIVPLAGPSAGIALARLLVEAPFLLLWLAAAAGFGAVWPLPGRGLLRVVSTVAIGLGTLGLIQLGLGLIGILHGRTAALLMLVGIVSLAFCFRRSWWNTVGQWLASPWKQEWLWLLVTPALAMALVAALVPPGVLWGDEPHGYDVLEYHLQLPREFYELGHIAPLHHNVFSYFPLGMEMHYLTAMELHRGPWAGMYLAQLMHVAVTGLAVVATYAAARRFAGKLPATLAAVAMANVPWLGLLAPVSYNEGLLLLFTTLAVAWVMEDSRGGWLIGGVLAGFACGVKLTAVPQVLLLAPIVAAGVAVAGRERIGEIVVRAMLFIIAGVIAFSPWLIRNFAWTRNPVFPEAQSVFGRAHFSAIQEQRWHDAHSPTPAQRSVIARLVAAKEQVLTDWRYGFLLLPAGLGCLVAAIRRPQAKVLLLLLLVWLIFWLALTHLQGRFYVTAIPLAAIGLATMQTRRQQVFAGFAAIVVVIIGVTISIVTFQERVGPYCQGAGLAFDDFAHIHDADVNDFIAAGREIALVGDAKAFLYPIGTDKLHYRTVFDVDVKPGQSVVEAWTQGVSGSPAVLVDPIEIDRFSRTYLGIPPLPADFPGPRDRQFILTSQPPGN